MHDLPPTSGRETLEIDLPLDPHTESAEDVSHLVSQFLREIDACCLERRVSPSDVLQALSITTAVHVARVEAQRRSGKLVALPLIGVELSAARRPTAEAA
ncbi:MAG: hypothetical protein MUC77_07805 [Chromatiaceae bacterium]|jgi:hypothetical protein|nr:hypothetical protein [Chromatiaceae bacterium]